MTAPRSSSKLPVLRDAVAEILRHTSPVEAESVPLSECLGRALRAELRVPFDLPPFDRSAMDGYAIAGEAAAYRLVSSVAAGESNPAALGPGECARIFTGASIPPGADRVALQEECSVSGTEVRPNHPVAAGVNIRRRAEDARAGEVALAPGQRLGAPQIGLAASLGASHLTVSRRPLVWILPTGNELVEPGAALKPGQIYNSNGPQVAAQTTALGALPRVNEILRDDPAKLRAAIGHALEQKADVLCISGGASVGDADYTRPALEACGFAVKFHGVDLKPGKPALFATRGKTLAFGIPGNPVSHLAVFTLLIAPAIRAVLGLPPESIRTASLKKAWKGKKDSRDRWFPSRVEHVGTGTAIEILRWKGSGDLASCREANALAHLPAPLDSAPEGDLLEYMPV